LMSPIEPSIQSPTLAPDLLLDTYFARIHGKPYYILDESTTRQRLQANQLPGHLAYAIYAVSARYAPHFGGYSSAVRIGQEYARRARLELEIDEPSIETLQTLMLLSQASFQLGKGKKTFMLLSTNSSLSQASTGLTSFSRFRYQHGVCARPTSRTTNRHESHTCRT
jgi:hypothetical protein